MAVWDSARQRPQSPHMLFQLHPTVAAATLAIGQTYGMRALRVPIEPWQILAEIDPQTQRGVGWITAPWARWLRWRARRAGLTIADAVFGLAWSGGMTAERLAALIGRLPAGFVEIYLHPAVTNTFCGRGAGLSLCRGIRRPLRCRLHCRGATIRLRARRLRGRSRRHRA